MSILKTPKYLQKLHVEIIIIITVITNFSHRIAFENKQTDTRTNPTYTEYWVMFKRNATTVSHTWYTCISTSIEQYSQTTKQLFSPVRCQLALRQQWKDRLQPQKGRGRRRCRLSHNHGSRGQDTVKSPGLRLWPISGRTGSFTTPDAPIFGRAAPLCTHVWPSAPLHRSMDFLWIFRFPVKFDLLCF